MAEEEKEYNPSLVFDAFTAGIEDGGMRSSSTIAIMVCYIIANCKEKITAKNIVDALVEEKLVNYFEISDAISKMIKKGNIVENEDGSLSITPSCKFSVDIVENDLPLSVRKKSVEAVMKIVKREIIRKENKVTIEEAKNGFSVTMHVSDYDSDFMKLSLYVPTKAQAEVIMERFLENPVKVYESLINSIFD